ncbi:MFS transporter [Streptomyces sp. A3M-1-3]|uniref:MFS transporter n=1 Tax=Streptomyces sp. A3M-1-3 TaxID=2962044 RepID=UPI0020B8B0C6|nr:MFS transporter [Streptomyces sp. A3M-1-3]MCP3822802.1 MFS transporter [Streptomyces sp. A3M-1-3]
MPRHQVTETSFNITRGDDPGPDSRRWKALALLCAAYFMVIVDSQIVILAMPFIESELGFTPAGVQWVMSAYLLSFGGLLLFGGRTADLLGGRRMFMIGTALFLAASLLCGLAVTSEMLIAARIAQGVAAAIMTPTAMAVLMHTFGEGPERNKALGVWTGIGAFGATAALLIGGPITELLGWEWIFFINIPIAGLILLLGPRVLRETPVRPGKRSFDPFGALTVTLAVALLVYGVVEAPEVGWGSGRTIGLLVAAAVLAVLFLMIEARSKSPLVPLKIFRSATFVGGNLLMLLVAMSVFGGALITSLYAQQVLGYSAIVFGLSTAIYAAMSIIGANVGARLAGKVGYKLIALVGAILLGTGLLLLSQVSADGNYWSDLFWGLVVFGTGIGSTNVAASIAALSGVRPEESGLASGVNGAVFQIGAAFGIAISSTVAVAVTDGSESRFALTEGFQGAFLATAVFAGLALLTALAMFLIRQPAAASHQAAEAEVPEPAKN